MRQLTWPTSTEPSIQQVLSDPIVRQMMACDNVREDDLIDLIEAVRHKLAVRVWRGGRQCSREPPVDELSSDHHNPWQRSMTSAQAPWRRAQ